MKKQAGFTQVELMTALTIAAILLAMATSGIVNATSAVRSGGAKSALTTSVAIAMSKATLHGSRTVLCPSLDGGSCLEGHDWSEGWVVFLDPDGDREIDPGEPVMHRQGALDDELALISTAGRSRIVFQTTGSNAGSNVTFTLCDGRGPRKAESLILSNEGRFRAAAAKLAAAMAACPP